MVDDILRNYRPSGEEAMIVDVGTNDLVNRITGEELAAKVLGYCKKFKEANLNLKKIYIMKIVDRVKTRAVSRGEFRREKDIYNEMIGKISANEDFIEVVNQDLGIMDIRRWSRDGIHPDTVLGKDAYKKTIKSVLTQLFNM